jgi:hypothetical protein
MQPCTGSLLFAILHVTFSGVFFTLNVTVLAGIIAIVLFLYYDINSVVYECPASFQGLNLPVKLMVLLKTRL